MSCDKTGDGGTGSLSQVDEALLRDVMPELDSTAAIRLWAQELVNLRIQELINEDEETMDIEEARTMVHETIRKEYMHSIAF